MNIGYFDWLGIEPAFEVDELSLKRAYIAKSRTVHPDHHQSVDSVELTSYTNEAYNTLRDPLRRLRYMIAAHTKIDMEKNELPQSFLMQMMDVNEQIMEASMSEDMEARESCRSDIAQLRAAQLESVSDILKEDPREIDDAKWRKLADYVHISRYLDRLGERLER